MKEKHYYRHNGFLLIDRLLGKGIGKISKRETKKKKQNIDYKHTNETFFTSVIQPLRCQNNSLVGK